MTYTMGSLFDGSGGFPLAATLCGIEPKWAAEVEPYPIAVTRSRFPKMRHLGSVTDVHGGEIEPVDIITFGSPCQDLSVAGNRAGLKHTDHGDEETTRSGLFMEAVRIIKEMREATNGEYPNFALWENVPGAFSSNRGEDFRTVLEKLIQIVEPSAVMPAVPSGGWAYADSYVGDGWSISYRVFDAQFWGVAQRRRRVYACLDLRGERAREILFEREGLRGYFAPSGESREGITADAQGGAGADDRAGNSLTAYSFDSLASNSMKSSNPHSGCREVDISKTLDTTSPDPSKNQGGIAIVETLPFDSTQVTSPQNGNNPKWGDPCHPLAATGHPPAVVAKTYSLQGNMIGRADQNGPQGDGVNEGVSFTLNTIDRHAVAYVDTYQRTTGPLMANSHPGSYTGQDAYTDMLIVGKTDPEPIAIDRAFFNQGVNAKYEPQLYEDGTTSTLVAKGLSAVCVRYIVRRLTPTECARLQGFADRWGDIEPKDSFTAEELKFWQDVRNTHAAINGKAVKDCTEKQMLTWYNRLHTDSSEYKMWGNGIALPTALYCMQGIADALQKEVIEDWML